MEFLIMVEIFSIFLLKLKIYSHDKFQKLCLLIKWIFFFFANRGKHFWYKYFFGTNCQIKNSKSVCVCVCVYIHI